MSVADEQIPAEEPRIEEATPAQAAPRRSTSDRVNLAIGLVLRCLLLLLLAIPTIHFFKVAHSRVTYPFESEWLEGELAMYTVRFLDEPSLAHLYPPYENGQYVPHLYPPLYQIAVAPFFAIFDSMNLGWGRLVSILSTLGIMLAMAAIVHNHTRQWFAALVAALTYPMFFKPSGYWYDLYRVDSFAYCLALWAGYFILARPGRWWQLAIGLALGFLAQFTKQTAVFIPAGAVMMRITFTIASALTKRSDPTESLVGKYHRFLPKPRHTIIVLAPFLLLVGNAIYLLRLPAYSNFLFYLYEVPSKHVIYWDTIRNRGTQELWQYYAFSVWLIPVALWVSALTRRWKPWTMRVMAIGIGLLASIIAVMWVRGGVDLPHPGHAHWGAHKPGMISPTAMQFVAGTWTLPIRWAFGLTVGGLAVWIVRWLTAKTPLRGVHWLAFLFIAQHIAAVTWVKIGGYINNFLPLFVIQGVAAGLAVAWLYQSTRRSWTRHIVTLGLIAMTWLTWNGTMVPFHVKPALKVALEEDKDKKAEELTKNLEGSRNRLADLKSELADLEGDSTRTMTLENQIQNAERRLDDLERQQKQLQDGEYQLDVRRYYNVATEIGYPLWDRRPNEEFPAFETDGLRYHYPARPWWPEPVAKPYGKQMPPEGAREAWQAFVDKVAELNKDGGVYLPHQNFVAVLAGAKPGPSIDSIRDVTYYPKPTPQKLLDRIKNKKPRYIITMMDLQYEWMTGDFQRVMQSNYHKLGPVLPPDKHPELMMPQTGATVRPTWIYEANQ
ncbi:hypothetical protein KQI84_13615 [bacterium]|nr:hypothetical protein [bacterium]